MFRKKPKNLESRRNVQRSPQAPVFSYYASRSPAEVPSRERGEIVKPKTNLSFKRAVSVLPSLLAVSALLLSLIYISTLSTSPNVQFVSLQNPHDHGLISNMTAYQSDFQAVLEKSPLNHSKLLINTDAIAKELSNRFPELGDISVVLPLVGRRPILKIRPAEPAVTLSAPGGPYVVDTTGRVLAYTKDVESSVKDQLPTVRDQSGLPVDRGSVVLTSQTISFIQLIEGQLSQAHMPIDALILPETSAGELHVQPAGKPYFVKFDMRGEGRLQAGTFLAVKDYLERSGKTPTAYVDVRVPEKAFYK